MRRFLSKALPQKPTVTGISTGVQDGEVLLQIGMSDGSAIVLKFSEEKARMIAGGIVAAADVLKGESKK